MGQETYRNDKVDLNQFVANCIIIISETLDDKLMSINQKNIYTSQ